MNCCLLSSSAKCAKSVAQSGSFSFVFLLLIRTMPSTERVQLAIKCGHLEMVKKLLPQCKLNHLDNNMNSIFHYAAPTTKEIINVSFLAFPPFKIPKIAQ